MSPLPPWLVVAVLVAAVLGTLAAVGVAVVAVTRMRNAEARLARRKAVEERAVRLAYEYRRGQLFDVAGGIRRATATYILTGKGDPSEVPFPLTDG